MESRGGGWIVPALLLYLAAFAIVLDSAAFPPNGIAGHDLDYFVPRLLEGLLFFRAQGISPPLYSPAFCGGIPFYANPQSIYYSLPQLLSLLMDPLLAIRLNTTLHMLAAAGGAWLLSSRALGLGRHASAAAVILFASNGFFASHTVAGHLSFQSFALLPLLCYGLCCPAGGVVAPALLVALVAGSLIYSGSYFSGLVMALALPATLLLVAALGSWRVPARTLVARGAAGFGIALLLSASKAVAVASYLKQFPRAGELQSTSNLLELALMVGGQLFALGAYRPWGNGLWEFNCSLSAPALLLLMRAGTRRSRGSETGWRGLTSARRAAALACAAICLGACMLAGGFPPLPWLAPKLPVLASLRSNIRFSAVLILPLSLLCAAIFDKLVEPEERKRLLLGLCVFSFAIPMIFRWAPIEEELYSFDTRRVAEQHLRFVSEPMESLAVKEVVRGHGEAVSYFGLRTNASCYEPLYLGVEPAASLTAGPVLAISGAEYNLLNPACLIYPRENGCSAGDRIARSDRRSLEALLLRGATEWKVSQAQARADMASVLGLGVWLALAVGVSARAVLWRAV